MLSAHSMGNSIEEIHWKVFSEYFELQKDEHINAFWNTHSFADIIL